MRCEIECPKNPSAGCNFLEHKISLFVTTINTGLSNFNKRQYKVPIELLQQRHWGQECLKQR